MTIDIERTGGFAGVEEKLATLDSSSLSPQAAAELRGLVARLSAWCAQNAESAGADRFRYEIAITEPPTPGETGPATQTLTVIDEGDPEHAPVKLVLALLDLARSPR